MHRVALAAAAALGSALAASAAITSSEAAMLATAARVTQDIRAAIPLEYWDRARCVVVEPDVKKTGSAGSGGAGKGVMSCRAGEGWSAPAFMQLVPGSWLVPGGAEQADVVLLVMNESGVQKVLQDKLELGADISVAPGPVGGQPPASADALKAEILSYARAQGLFAGTDLSGAALRPDVDANHDVYGETATPRTILAMRSLSAPTQATAFLNALGAAASALPAAAAPAEPPAASKPGTGGAASPSTSPTPSGGTSTAETDLRARVVALQQAIDRLIIDAETSPTGTTGGAASGADTIAVSRERLMQLRRQLDAILAIIDKR